MCKFRTQKFPFLTVFPILLRFFLSFNDSHTMHSFTSLKWLILFSLYKFSRPLLFAYKRQAVECRHWLLIDRAHSNALSGEQFLFWIVLSFLITLDNAGSRNELRYFVFTLFCFMCSSVAQWQVFMLQPTHSFRCGFGSISELLSWMRVIR